MIGPAVNTGRLEERAPKQREMVNAVVHDNSQVSRFQVDGVCVNSCDVNAAFFWRQLIVPVCLKWFHRIVAAGRSTVLVDLQSRALLVLTQGHSFRRICRFPSPVFGVMIRPLLLDNTIFGKSSGINLVRNKHSRDTMQALCTASIFAWDKTPG